MEPQDCLKLRSQEIKGVRVYRTENERGEQGTKIKMWMQSVFPLSIQENTIQSMCVTKLPKPREIIT